VQSISFEDLDKMMDNNEVPQFNYETFDAAFQADERIKNLVGHYTQDEVSFVDKAPAGGADGDSVGKMAKRAVDLSDL
tara:strand:- start:2247 stop:2480 length:234 start_codon:yes stop_codon:yes gene_type:complete